MQTQRNNPSVIKAIASLNNAQRAQQSGDALGFDLAVREITLAAKQQRMKAEEAHNKEVAKLRDDLFTTGNKLQQALATNAIRKKAQDAYESGNNVLGDKYMALLSGQQRPDELQRYDVFKGQEYETEGEKQLAQQFLDPNYTPSALDTLRLAREEGLATLDSSKRMFERQGMEQTDEEKNAQLLDSLVQQGFITREESLEILKDILNPPQRRSQTDAGQLIDTVGKYPAFGANRTALDRLTQLLPKDKGQKVGANLDAMLQGRTFDEIPDDQKKKIAESMGYIALADPPGGEIVQRFNFAQTLLKNNIPNIMEGYNKVRGKLGRLTQTSENVFRFTGQTTDPEIARFQANLERLVSDYVVLRSGAQITDREFQRYLSTLPSIGNNAEVNDQMMNAMIDSLNTYFSSYYTQTLGEQWGNEATRAAMGEYARVQTSPESAPGDTPPPSAPAPQATTGNGDAAAAGALTVTPRTLPEGVTEDQIQQIMQRSGKTRAEVVKRIMERRAQQ